ncbi:hypothetical protein C380_08740 [Acidovorax sp. KKS102]|uniref:hypothetical protein n=1 Tax=Acidovorax sp. KKS102 TaxID=358220 RepID=UPI00028B5A7D|nr:hypothetical protein [Acidovorax sp. KKS102]AFU45450.1 hypothetical protein C380_08740 [Acidovorax sp. KKS102]
MKPATPFQKMRERRIAREQLAREVAMAEVTADLRGCEVNWRAALLGLEPPHRSASNYQECLEVFATAQKKVKPQPVWRRM